MIQVRTELNIEQFKKLNKFFINKGLSSITKNIMISVLAIIDVFFIFAMIFLDIETSEVLPAAIMAFVMLLIVLFTYNILPNLFIKKYNVLDSVATYEFSEDSCNFILVNKNINESGNMKYDLFVRISETRDCFYLFMAKNRALIVDKSGFISGNEDDLRDLLRKSVDAKKYKYYGR